MTGGQGVCLLFQIGSCFVDSLPVWGVPPAGVVRWRDLALVPLLVERSLYLAVGLLLSDGTCRISFLVPMPSTFFYVPGFVPQVSLSRFALGMVDGLVISGVSLGPYSELLTIGCFLLPDPPCPCPGLYLPCLL